MLLLGNLNFINSSIISAKVRGLKDYVEYILSNQDLTLLTNIELQELEQSLSPFFSERDFLAWLPASYRPEANFSHLQAGGIRSGTFYV
jgi:hypothetical protein